MYLYVFISTIYVFMSAANEFPFWDNNVLLYCFWFCIVCICVHFWPLDGSTRETDPGATASAE